MDRIKGHTTPGLHTTLETAAQKKFVRETDGEKGEMNSLRGHNWCRLMSESRLYQYRNEGGGTTIPIPHCTQTSRCVFYAVCRRCRSLVFTASHETIFHPVQSALYRLPALDGWLSTRRHCNQSLCEAEECLEFRVENVEKKEIKIECLFWTAFTCSIEFTCLLFEHAPHPLRTFVLALACRACRTRKDSFFGSPKTKWYIG